MHQKRARAPPQNGALVALVHHFGAHFVGTILARAPKQCTFTATMHHIRAAHRHHAPKWCTRMHSSTILVHWLFFGAPKWCVAPKWCTKSWHDSCVCTKTVHCPLFVHHFGAKRTWHDSCTRPKTVRTHQNVAPAPKQCKKNPLFHVEH